MLPEGLQAFSRLPFWNSLFLALAVGIALYCGWGWWQRRGRQDLYYFLMGAYLAVTQAPIVFPALGRELLPDQPLAGSGLGIVLAIPAVVLFVLGVRARDTA